MSVQLTCKIHKVPLVCFCPACRGSVTSEAKAEAARRNGRLGGRPRKRRQQAIRSYRTAR